MSTDEDLNKRKKWIALAKIAGPIPQSYQANKNELIEKNAFYWNAVMGEVFKETLSKRKKLTIFPILNEEEKKHLVSTLGQSNLTLDDFKDSRISFTNMALNRIHFDGFVFPIDVVFSNCKFQYEMSFENAIFLNEAIFNKSSFEHAISFRSAKFLKGANLIECSFHGEAIFENSYFKLGADFENAAFYKPVSFYKSKFMKSTHFSYVIFSDFADFSESVFRDVDFESANFNKDSNFTNVAFLQRDYIFKNEHDFINFRNANFSGELRFINSIIEGGIDFYKCKFKSDTNFYETKFDGQANFASTKFSTSLSFHSAIFTKTPPYFFDASVSEDIDISDISLPKCKAVHEKSTYHDLPSTHILAYERLKLLMSKLERDHDKHLFYRREMHARRAQEGPWFSSKFFSKLFNLLYDLSSNYGYNFERALMLWFGNILLGIFVLFPYTKYVPDLSVTGIKFFTIEFLSTLGVSFSNSHSFFGLHKGALKQLYSGEHDVLFYTIWFLQSVIGAMLLFILLLTIRNRFKIG